LPVSPSHTTMSSATPSYSSDAQNKKHSSRPKSAEISSYHAKLVATAPDQLENVLSQPHPSATNESPELPQPYPSSINNSPELHQPQPSAVNESPDFHQPHPSDANESPELHPCAENESLNFPKSLPDLHPPHAVLPLETPPSPVAMVRMSPKVAASLEKIDQVLAAASGDSSDIVSDHLCK